MAAIPDFEIDDRFGYHPPSDAHIVGGHEKVRSLLAEVAKQLTTIVPAGREQAVMVTKLEEAMYWGNAGIARQQSVGG